MGCNSSHVSAEELQQNVCVSSQSSRSWQSWEVGNKSNRSIHEFCSFLYSIVLLWGLCLTILNAPRQRLLWSGTIWVKFNWIKLSQVINLWRWSPGSLHLLTMAMIMAWAIFDTLTHVMIHMINMGQWPSGPPATACTRGLLPGPHLNVFTNLKKSNCKQ